MKQGTIPTTMSTFVAVTSTNDMTGKDPKDSSASVDTTTGSTVQLQPPLPVQAISPQSATNEKAIKTSTATTATGGIFFCGYENSQLAQALFPDYMARYHGGYDYETHHDALKYTHQQLAPTSKDILVFGMHGPCKANIKLFPGKILFINGEPNGSNMPDTITLEGRSTVGEDVYQIGLLPDSQRSVLMYHGCWNMMRLEEAIRPTLWDPTRKPINSGKYQGLMYMSSKCHAHREQAVHSISKIMPVYHGGACHGNLDHDSNANNNVHRMPNIPAKRFWIYNRNAYAEYKFCMAMENSLTPHYVSEKIIMAFLAGCIPIYYGSQEVFDVFNKAAFVFYDTDNPEPALEQLRHLSRNETAYQDMLHHQPILAHGEQTVREYFSVSDSIGGGYLKAKLRTTMGLPG